MAPGRCDVQSRCRSVSVFQKWACADVVVGAVGHSTRNYEDGGVWYVVGGTFRSPPFVFPLFPLSQYAGTYPECSEMSIEPRKCLDESTGRYPSAYACKESIGGPLTCRTRTDVCRRCPRLRDGYSAVSPSLIGSLAI